MDLTSEIVKFSGDRQSDGTSNTTANDADLFHAVRLCGFSQRPDEIGNKLTQANEVYSKASDRLRGTDGKHSVVKKGEELKLLGVKMKKKMDLPTRLQVPFDGAESAGISDKSTENGAEE